MHILDFTNELGKFLNDDISFYEVINAFNSSLNKNWLIDNFSVKMFLWYVYFTPVVNIFQLY